MKETQQTLEQLAMEYREEGLQNLYANKLEEAVELERKALDIFKEIKLHEWYATTINALGVIYGTMGNDNMAMDCYLEGLDYANRHKCIGALPLFYNNIGTRYQELCDHEKAIAYFRKSKEEIDRPEHTDSEAYRGRVVIVYLNLCRSYYELGEYEQARVAIEKAKEYQMKGKTLTCYPSLLVSECRVYWTLGKEEYVYERLDELLSVIIEDENATDYLQDIREACNLMSQMKEYENWKKVILSFEVYVKKQGTVYFQLILNELWMEYYRQLGDEKHYIDCCVEHTALYHKQKKVTDMEHAAALDMKISLRKKEAERREAEKKMNMDTLTGIGNRCKLERDSTLLLQKAKEQGTGAGIGIMDIDCFKSLNDTYGHLRGDDCLIQVAATLKQAIGCDGEVYRFGGDEFVVLIPDGTKEKIRQVAEQIIKNLRERKRFDEKSAALPEITISQGYVCMSRWQEKGLTELLEYADEALYQVKKNGENNFYITEK